MDSKGNFKSVHRYKKKCKQLISPVNIDAKII